ncbi:quaternary ammonium compound-resistance protein SugE [Arcanobacterium wilhelmae]|uniref:Quaternary ammonium compound-resistance protein SugE n=1 Tax=Arcanobacterium wilhelmae TaxID=1803177 RepID=A0ABT9N8H9_9ACTO|nr:SMR family transporter [Arcanobacterium wilhelmae]MDP9800005.1 quaternary ammonium compound-resistance protein SugE [Arcanobacterium wilhelmae]WFN89503.1 SMR family transporter [Arcanobacterium wilhelmae]
MAWIILLASGVMEAVWAIALSKSEGLKKLWPSVIFLVTNVLSLIGLAVAMKHLPTGTAYAAWTATGASLTVVYAMVSGEEKATLVRIGVLLALVACVVGLKVVA